MRDLGNVLPMYSKDAADNVEKFNAFQKYAVPDRESKVCDLGVDSQCL